MQHNWRDTELKGAYVGKQPCSKSIAGSEMQTLSHALAGIAEEPDRAKITLL